MSVLEYLPEIKPPTTWYLLPVQPNIYVRTMYLRWLLSSHALQARSRSHMFDKADAAISKQNCHLQEHYNHLQTAKRNLGSSPGDSNLVQKRLKSQQAFDKALAKSQLVSEQQGSGKEVVWFPPM